MNTGQVFLPSLSLSLGTAQEGYEVAEESEGRLVYARVVLDDRQLPHGVGVQHQNVAQPPNGSQRVEHLELFGFDLADYLLSLAVGAGHEPQAPVAPDGAANQFPAIFGNSLPANLFGACSSS